MNERFEACILSANTLIGHYITLAQNSDYPQVGIFIVWLLLLLLVLYCSLIHVLFVYAFYRHPKSRLFG